MTTAEATAPEPRAKRRCFQFKLRTLLLAVTAAAVVFTLCRPANWGVRTSSSFTWQGKQVEVRTVGFAGSQSHMRLPNELRVVVNDHSVTVTSDAISLDGKIKTVPEFAAIAIEGAGNSVRVVVDGQPVFD